MIEKKYDEEKWGNQDNRYWIEEIKSDWTPYVHKSDVLDYDKILYVLHDNQAFEDYPVAMSPNVNLLMGLCDRLNEYEIEVQELKKELKRCKGWINSDIDDYELTLAFIKSKGYSLKEYLNMKRS